MGIGDVFAEAVRDVLKMRDTMGFRGVVDVGVTFDSVAVDSRGLIRVLVGNDTSKSSTRVQLATRVHLDDEESPGNG